MGHVPYKLLNRSELSHLASAVRSACAPWANAWLGDAATFEVACHRAADHATEPGRFEGSWLSAGIADGRWLSASTATPLLAQLGAALLASESSADAQGEAKRSPLLRELAGTALNELLEAILRGGNHDTAVARVPQSPDAGFWKAGSGAVVAEVSFGGSTAVLALNPALVRALLRGARRQSGMETPLDSAAAALSNGRLPLQVLVGEAQLELGLLQTIVVGDVIRLDARADQPLQVVNADGVRLCGAYLGTRGVQKSIQLTK